MCIACDVGFTHKQLTSHLASAASCSLNCDQLASLSHMMREEPMLRGWSKCTQCAHTWIYTYIWYVYISPMSDILWYYLKIYYFSTEWTTEQVCINQKYLNSRVRKRWSWILTLWSILPCVFVPWFLHFKMISVRMETLQNVLAKINWDPMTQFYMWLSCLLVLLLSHILSFFYSFSLLPLCFFLYLSIHHLSIYQSIYFLCQLSTCNGKCCWFSSYIVEENVPVWI
jgi:hypothetical protein